MAVVACVGWCSWALSQSRPDDGVVVETTAPKSDPPETGSHADLQRDTTTVTVPPAPTTLPTPATSEVLDETQRDLLQKWILALGPRRPSETFGDLVVRAARVQLGRPYVATPDTPEPEKLRVDLRSFQCVTLVESTLSVARCVWSATPDEACFVHEIEQTRYRDGRLLGWNSRLHYFIDWLDDNAARGRLEPLTEALGGAPRVQPFFYLTRRIEEHPALGDPEVRAGHIADEARLSQAPHPVISRGHLAAALPRLASGDVIAISSRKPGLFISHTGFVIRTHDGVTRLLHASSTHKRVVITSGSLADYVEGSATRSGILASRPLAPGPLETETSTLAPASAR